MNQIATVLTVAEVDVLTDCEETIERGLKTFNEVGAALMTIRDNRLYRAEFPTFEEYAKTRWGLSGRRAYQLIDASVVRELISGTDVQEINNEAQARELAPLLDDPQELREAYTVAVERTNGKPTAAAIREVVREREQVLVERPRPPAWDTEDRRRHEEEVRRRQDIDAARRTAETIVTSVRSAVVTVIAGCRYGERDLVTADMVQELREVIDLLEGEL